MEETLTCPDSFLDSTSAINPVGGVVKKSTRGDKSTSRSFLCKSMARGGYGNQS